MKYSIALLLTFSTITAFAMDQGNKELVPVSDQAKQELAQKIAGELGNRALAIIDEIANKLSNGNLDKKPVVGDRMIDVWLRDALNQTTSSMNLISKLKDAAPEYYRQEKYRILMRRAAIESALGLTAELEAKLEYETALMQSKKQPK